MGSFALKELALEKAKLYGDFLVDSAIETKDEMTWTINQVFYHDEVPWDNAMCIDGGSTGIILYLAGLYSATRDGKYLDAAIKGMNRVIRESKSDISDNFSFYKGKAGVIYVLTQLYELTGKKNYLDHGVELALASRESFLRSAFISDSLYSGRAGMLLALLHLFNASQNSDVADLIEQYAVTIISHAQTDGRGLYWRAQETLSVRPLCSLGEGAAGIAHVFAELGKYFENDGFNWISRQALLYVQDCWNEAFNNWSDYRKDILDGRMYQKYLEDYVNGDRFLFKVPKDDVSWRNGTLGIALSILGCFQRESSLTPDRLSAVLEKLKKLLDEGKIQSMDLCDGLSALYIVFDRAYKETGNDSYLEILSSISAGILTVPDEGKTLEGGLMRNNLLGKALLCLFIAQPELGTANVLLPSIKPDIPSNKKGASMDLPLYKTRRLILEKYFGRTIALAEKIEPALLFNWFKNIPLETDKIIDLFAAFITNWIDKGLGFDLEALKEVFALEKLRIQLMGEATDAPLRYFEDTLHYEFCVKQLNNGYDWLLERSLEISEEVKIISTKWNWITRFDKNGRPWDLTENINKAPGRHRILLKADNWGGVSETALDVAGLILDRFSSKKHVSAALSEITFFCQSQTSETLKPIIELSNSKDGEELLSRLPFIVLYQVKQLICERVLVFSDN